MSSDLESRPVKLANAGTKEIWKPGTMLCPLPVVMVTCVGREGRPNIFTVAWTGIVCTDPPMLSISVRPERYSYELLQETGEFVVNIPSVREVRATDLCGVISGREVDKFERTGLTPAPASVVSAPLIRECPVSLECRVTQTLSLGSHTLFLAETWRPGLEKPDDGVGALALERQDWLRLRMGIIMRWATTWATSDFRCGKKSAAAKDALMRTPESPSQFPSDREDSRAGPVALTRVRARPLATEQISRKGQAPTSRTVLRHRKFFSDARFFLASESELRSSPPSNPE
jgi:flavin reductase (DIM6/NTAB) family NADH-FMN oxidoreductase RutF